MADRSGLRQMLQTLAYFASASPDQLMLLETAAQRRILTPNEGVFLEGDPSSGLWLIEHGRIKIFKLSMDGEEHILHLLGAGDTFNDIAAFDGGANPANATALIDSTLWLIPAAVLQTLIAADGHLALTVIRLLAGRVRRLVIQIEDLALHSVTIRLARFLLQQLDNPALSGPGITRVTIAAHLATKPETISRALRSLEQAQAIRFDRQRIIIEREDLLRTIAAL